MRTEATTPGAPPDDPVRAALDDEQSRARLCVQARAMLHRLPAGQREPLAEDLAHEAIARALRGRDNYDPAKGTVASWLGGILNNVVRDHFRSLSRRPVALAPGDADGWERLAVDLSSADDKGHGGFADLAPFVARLSPSQQELVRLRFWEGLDSASIAARLEIGAIAVRVRLSRTLDKLRRMLSNQTREVGR